MNKENLKLIEVGWSLVMLGITTDFSKYHDYEKIFKVLAEHGRQIKKEVKEL